MSNPLQQTIEALAKEKGIEPDVVIGAIEDAVLTASRKYYKTNENLKTRFNQDTGQVDLFAVKQIVTEVTNTTKKKIEKKNISLSKEGMQVKMKQRTAEQESDAAQR